MKTNSLDRRFLLKLLAGTSVGLWACGSTTNAGAVEVGRLPDGDSAIDGSIQLQAIGALGVGHIQSTLGLIGVIADSISKEIYNPKQIEDLMNGTINGLHVPMKILRRLQESNVSEEDAEFLDRMIAVLNALQLEAKALSVFSKTRKADDASKYERERRRVLKKLSELTQHDEFVPMESEPQAVPGPNKANPNSSSNSGTNPRTE